MTFLQEWGVAVRMTAASMAVCVGLYSASVLLVGQALMPGRADGSLVRNAGGNVVGSILIAQNFSRPEYLWPRPSATDYNAAAAGGSNGSPAGPEVRTRAGEVAARFGADAARPLPADLAAASGSGLDPHITLAAARYQAKRVAAARGRPVAAVLAAIDSCAERPLFGGEPLVNVLKANLNLDKMVHGHGLRTRR